MRRVAAFATAAAIWLGTSAPCFAQSVANGGFEAPVLSANSFLYDPAGATWAFVANSGIVNAPGAGFLGPAAPEGNQYAFLQTAGNTGAFSQSIVFSLSGTYELSDLVAGRSDNGQGALGNLAYEVLFDSVVIGNDVTSTGQPFTSRSFDFMASPGSHTLTFESVSNSGDNTAFFDLVAIRAVPEPTVTVFVLSSLFGFSCLRVMRRHRDCERINNDSALT